MPMAVPPCPACWANTRGAAAIAVAAAPVVSMVRLIGSMAKRQGLALMTASVARIGSTGASGAEGGENRALAGPITQIRAGFGLQNLDFRRIEARLRGKCGPLGRRPIPQAI